VPLPIVVPSVLDWSRCGTHVHLYFHPTSSYRHLHTLMPSCNIMRPFTVSSHVSPLCPLPPPSGLILHMQAFHLTHPMGSSLPPISLSRSLEWHMFIRPFKETANRLAYFWSCLRLPNPLRLSLWAFIPGRGRYNHYRSLTEEQRWWDESARIRAFFAPLDARHGEVKASTPECLSPIPLITSYVPRLLPQYRDHSRLDDAANDYELMPSTYRKWHRLVFPHEVRLLQKHAMRRAVAIVAESTLPTRGSEDYQIHQHT
jgi:hypothetical protein